MPITKSSYIIDNTAGVGSRMNVHVSGAGGAGNPGIFGANGTTAIIGTIGTNGGGTGASWMWQDSSVQPPMRYEHPIQGQMFMVSYEIHDSVTQSYNDWRNETKKRLSLELANKMLEEGVIEFTQTDNLHSGHKTIRARCYLVPDNQVRILRTLYKDK